MQAARARGRAERLVRRRAPVDREAVATAPTCGQPRLVPREHDDAAAEPPPASGDLVGDVEAPGRRRRARGADRDPPPEDDMAVLAQRQQPLRQVGLDRVADRAEADGRGAGHPADHAVPQDVALHGKPVAASADHLEPPHRAEGRLPASRRRAPCFRVPAGSAPSPSSRRRASCREAPWTARRHLPTVRLARRRSSRLSQDRGVRGA